jgi:hypothetical protein
LRGLKKTAQSTLIGSMPLGSMPRCIRPWCRATQKSLQFSAFRLGQSFAGAFAKQFIKPLTGSFGEQLM